MSANGSAIPTEATEVQDKGKGKSVEEPSRTVGMEEDEDEEEESGLDEAPEDDDDEDMDEINPENIVTSRTRNKDINWAEAEEKLRAEGENVEDDEDDEDDDFEDPDANDDDDAMRD